MEIRRFGPGHRRAEGPPGSHGVAGRIIHQDARGSITELAFGPRAVLAPHANPRAVWFVVVSGTGVVQVGAERVAVNHGEAVLWPAGELRAAWTEGTEMRAILVEFAGDEGSADDPGVVLALADPLPDRRRGELTGPDGAPGPPTRPPDEPW